MGFFQDKSIIMITLHDLISETPMYRSLTAATQARYMRRASKRIHRHFRRAGMIDGVIDGDFTDDFAARFAVTPDNAKTVVRLICTVWSFSWLGMIFNVLWAAFYGAAPVVIIAYLLGIGMIGSLFISFDSYLMLNEFFLFPSFISLMALTALFGRSLAIYDEAAELVARRLGVEIRWKLDRIATTILGSRRPWVRFFLYLTIILGLLGVEAIIGEALYGEQYFLPDPFGPLY